MLSPLYRRLASLILGKPSNFSWFRSNLAASGMPHGKRAFEWLKSKGITAIINLTERPYHVEGFKISHIPMEDMMPSTPEMLALAVNFIKGYLNSGHKVLVHCMAGMGRTGMVLASYLVMYEGYNAKDAIEEVRRVRSGSLLLEGQMESVEEFERYVAKDVYVIVLAAGMATRFGKNKLLYPIQGRPMIRGVVEESVKAGLRAVMDKAKAVMFLPGDVAFIRVEQIRAVYDDYVSNDGPIVLPTYRGRGGHPILFDRSLFEEIMGITEEGRGLKSVVQAHRNEIRRIELGTARILVDIDTERDLEERIREIQEVS